MVINTDKKDTALTEFLESEQAVVIMEHIASIERQRKALETEEKEIRKSLENMMEYYGVQSFENDILKVTFKPTTTRVSIDSAKVRAEYPEVFEECKKVTNVKSSVVIKVKGE